MLDADAGIRLGVKVVIRKLSPDHQLNFSVIRLLSLPETRLTLNSTAVRSLIGFYTSPACVGPCRNGRGHPHILVTSVILYV